ncbi:MAG: tetratricopeptide repeat protein [Candidatus Eisenbacteria bacterium]|nr:tetratricopeptide repeat protein [Candidatus Eisenbacteria bacterium]
MTTSRIMGFMAVVVVALHWIGAFLPGSNTWGFHHWAFLPRPLLFLIGGLSMLLLVPAVARLAADALAPMARALETGRRPIGLLAVLFTLFALGFWFGRQRLFLLSDGELLIRLVAQGLPSLAFTADTLGALIQLWVNVFTVDILKIDSQTASFRIVSMVCGLIWLAAMFRTVGRLMPHGWSRLLAGGLLATAGITRLFYGYVETGPLLAAAVALFVLAGVRLVQDGRGVAAATFTFLLASAMHVTGLLLFPAWAWLLWHWSRDDSRRRRLALALLTLPILMYGAIWSVFGGSARAVGDLYAPYFGKFLTLLGPTDGKRAYTLLSPARWTEFLNEQFLLGPFALLALVGLWLALPRRERPAGPEVRFLLLLLAPFLLLSILFNRELGGARDWDLVANLAVPAILLVAVTLARAPAPDGGSQRERRDAAPGPSPGLVITLLSASLFHLIGFVLVDARPDRSLAHFLTLFESGAPVSPFARSYALEEVGRYELERGRTDEAIRHLEDAARVDPGNVKAVGTLGSLYNSRGDLARAMPHLEQAVRLRPDMALNHYNLGAARMSGGRSTDAARAFEEALRLDPNLEPAWLGLANMALALKLTAIADSVAREGQARFPANADLMVVRAAVREQAGRFDEAIQILETARIAAPDNQTVLYNLGRLRNDQGNYQAAIGSLSRLTALAPDDAEAWNNLGVAQLQLLQFDAAGQAFVNAINANADLIPAHVNLAEALFRMGRREEALGTLQAFIDRRPGLAKEAGMDRMMENLRQRSLNDSAD